MEKNRTTQEKNVLTQMVRIYCKGHRHRDFLCDDCIRIIEYANQQLDVCVFKEDKPFCSKCTIHCYSPDMREYVKKVMRYSGPRMILYNPIMAIKHLVQR